jgi:hypothetical protein
MKSIDEFEKEWSELASSFGGISGNRGSDVLVKYSIVCLSKKILEIQTKLDELSVAVKILAKTKNPKPKPKPKVK